MRCPDCNKFVGFDADTEPEVDVRVDDDGMVSGSVRITNNCTECGQELKQAEFEVDIDFTDEVRKHKVARPNEPHALDVELNASRTDWMQTKDRRGNTIKSYRYMKHMYGAEGAVVLTCSCMEEPLASQDWGDAVSGSGME
jgi:hypothetical protein